MSGERAIRFCLGCLRDLPADLVYGQDRDGVEHTYGGSTVISPSALAAFVAVTDAARLVRDLQDAGGNEWWEAHARLYLALDAFHANCAESVAAGGGGVTGSGKGTPSQPEGS